MDPHYGERRKLTVREASREGDVETLRSMIQQHPELATTEPNLLHHACMYGHLEVVKLLIKELHWKPQCRTNSESIEPESYLPVRNPHAYGMSPYWSFETMHTPDCRYDWKKGDTPLHVACRYGHIKIVRYLTKEEPCSQVIPNDTTGELPLHIACYRRDLVLVKQVSDCDVNTKTKCAIRKRKCPDLWLAEECDTPLHVACRQRNLEIVKYLCEEKHCCANVQNAAGELPLHIACGRTRSDGQTLDIVKAVSDCNVNTQTQKDKATPLHVACRQSDLETVRYLCKEKHCDTNIQNAAGDTPLHVACRQRNLEIVKYLCEEKHCCANVQNAAGELPLHIACGKKRSDGQTLDIVKAVSDCDVNTQTQKDKATPLHVACRQSDLETVRYLCKEKHCDTNIQNAAGDTPLHVACRQRNLEIVKYLCKEKHCDISIKNAAGELLLHIACGMSRSDGQTLDIVKAVSDCNVNTQTQKDKDTPLHIACRQSDLETVRYLCKEKHCDTNIQNAAGDTPLHVACRQRNLEIARYLCEEKHCCANVQNAAGELPLHIACGRTRSDGQTLDIVKAVSDCDVNAQTRQHNDTPLHIACRQSNLKTVRYLCEEKDCDISIHNAAGELPLHIACGRTRSDGQTLDIVKAVSDCNVNTQTQKDKDTPLHIACRQSDLETVRYLCKEKHCDTNIQNAAGDTPLHVACRQRNLEIARYLCEEKHCCANVQNAAGELPLHIACGRTRSDGQTLDIVKLVSDCNVNTQTSFEKSTPLHIACCHLQFDIAKYLVYVKHCDVNVKDHNGEQPLHIAYRLNKEHVQLVLMLISEGSDTKVLPDLLHWASRHGELDIVKLLVEKQDWDPNAQCQAKSMSYGWELEKGDTLLHAACRYGYMYTVKIVKYLTEHCDPTVRNSNGELPLHLACAYKPLEVVKRVSNCDVNAKTSHTGNTPLHIACERRNIETVKYLVEERHCDTTVRNSNGQLPLHIACADDSLEMVKLVSKFGRSQSDKQTLGITNVNTQTWFEKSTPLHIACRHMQIDVAKYLVDVKQCDLNVKDHNGEQPLHIAYRLIKDVKHRKDGVKLVLLLINEGSDTMIMPDLLHWACRHGELDIVKLLVEERHCDPNAQCQAKSMSYGWELEKGDTLLHAACRYCYAVKIMKYLTEHCDPTVRNSDGDLPLHLACAYKSLEVVKRVSNCDVNAKTSHTGNTPLHIACERGSAEIVKYLVETRHCNTTVRNSNGELPLHISCTHDSLEVVKRVSNCDVNAKTSHTGNTPLHIAYQYGERSIIRFLVEVRFCDLNIRNNDGLLPSDRKQLMQHERYQQTHNIKEYQEALRQKGVLPMRLLKLLISGPPRVGKSSLKWRLVGKRIEIEFSPSTGVADAPTKVTIKGLRQSIAKACGSQWSQLSVDERAAAILVPLLKKTDSIVASEQKEEQDVGSDTHAEHQGFEMFSTDSLEPLEASTHHETAPGIELVNESPLHRPEYDEDFVTSNQSATCQSDSLQSDSKSSHDLVTTCTTSDVGSIYSGTFESPCQYKKEVEFVATSVKGVNREHVTPDNSNELTPPQISIVDDVEPTPKVNVDKQISMVHDTLCPDNIETTTDPDSKDGCMLLQTLSTTTATTTEQPLNTYPGFQDLAGLVSIPLLQEGDEEKLKELLVNTTTLHIVDTGGQPEFHEILPALVTGPAVNLILFKLNEGLQERYVVEYLSRDGKSSEPYVTSYTNEDVIFQTLSTIACFSHHDSESIGASCVNAVGQEAVAVLVGTHMDQISESREKKIQEVDESLRDRIQRTEFYTDDLIKFFSPGSEQMIVPVDNTETCEDKAGITALREMLNKIFLERFDEVYVPPTWLIFDLVLRKSGAKTLNIHKCFKVAQLCGIESEEEFKEALWYLHHQVGVLMHFPEVSTVKDVVIVELQLLFDCITDVMVNTFTKERTSPFENDLFKYKGQFLPKRVRSESRKKQDPLALDKLVKLLEYLHIVAHMVDHSDPSGKKNAYFMPCVLQSAELGMVFHNPDSSPDQPAPLLIRFSCGFCPVGIFCAIVVYLLSSSEVKWQLSGEEPLNRNMITFKVGKAYDKVTLIARTTFYEIWLQRQMNTDVDTHMTLHEMCNNVRIQLHAAIQAVSSTLHYSYRSSHEFGFYCPQTACYKSQMAPRNHIAVCSYDNPSHMKCLISDKPSPLPPMCAVWYGREIDLASLSVDDSEGVKPMQQTEYQTAELRKIPVDSTPLKPTAINLANLERELHGVHKWFDLGLELGLSSSTLQRIKLDHRENTSKCLHDMLCSWLTEKDNVKAKGGANWETLVNALKSSKVEECKLAAQVSRNHRKKLHLSSAQRPSASPSSHTRIHPRLKASPHPTLAESVHQSPHQQQRVKKPPLLSSSRQTQKRPQDQRDRTTSEISDQVPQVQQTAPQQGMSSLH